MERFMVLSNHFPFITSYETDNTVVIKLNRPKSYNALNRLMITRLRAYLQNASNRWLVLIGDENAFSAGGDIIEGHHLNRDLTLLTDPLYTALFEFYHYEKLVTIWRGISMGTGLGLTLWGKYRVATSSTVLAFPEQEIGIPTDVGSNYFATQKLDHAVGLFWLLTGHRLNGSDVYHLGIATHYIDDKYFDDVVEELKTGEPEQVLAKYHEEPDPTQATLNNLEEQVQKCFGNVNSISEILQRCT